MNTLVIPHDNDETLDSFDDVRASKQRAEKNTYLALAATYPFYLELNYLLFSLSLSLSLSAGLVDGNDTKQLASTINNQCILALYPPCAWRYRSIDNKCLLEFCRSELCTPIMS